MDDKNSFTEKTEIIYNGIFTIDPREINNIIKRPHRPIYPASYYITFNEKLKLKNDSYLKNK